MRYPFPRKEVDGESFVADCRAAGLPVTLVGDDGVAVAVGTSRPLSEGELDALAALYAAHVAPTAEEVQAARRARAKAKARDAFADTLDPIATAARNADRALFRSLKQTREKINKVIAWINANGGAITPLTNRSFAQAMQGAAQLVDAETDPTGD